MPRGFYSNSCIPTEGQLRGRKCENAKREGERRGNRVQEERQKFHIDMNWLSILSVLSVCLSVCTSFCLSIGCLFVLFIVLTVCQLFCLYICLFFCLSIYCLSTVIHSVYPLLYLSVCLSFLSFCLSVCKMKIIVSVYWLYPCFFLGSMTMHNWSGFRSYFNTVMCLCPAAQSDQMKIIFHP